MTLGTFIRTDAPVNPTELLDFLTVRVGGDPATALRTWRRKEDGEVGNDLMQGFAAIVAVKFGLDGPLDEENFDHPDKYEAADGGWVPAPVAAIQVWLDTGYGYHHPETGENCEQLHRRLGVETAAWVRERVPDARCWINMDTFGEWWEIDQPDTSG